jgi:hypothetical protein
VNKTLAFHTSTNYQIRAPAPFTADVHVNVPQELARIKRQSYSSEYDFHVDLSRTVKRLNDGHCVWTFGCYVRLVVLIEISMLIKLRRIVRDVNLY